MEDVLAHCDARFPTMTLCTEHAEYYEPFGFRVIPEHRFRARVEPQSGRAGFRSLDLTRESELDLLDRLLAARTPVSDTLGVVRDQDVFKFNLEPEALHYCEELDLLAVMRRNERELQLDDLVGSELPKLADLLARIAEPVEEVIFHFRPDRLAVEARPERFRWDNDVLMVRGPFPLDPVDADPAAGFMLPPLARH
jgi:hypothetical protein